MQGGVGAAGPPRAAADWLCWLGVQGWERSRGKDDGRGGLKSEGEGKVSGI